MGIFERLMNNKKNGLYNDMQAVENYADAQKVEALRTNPKQMLTPLQITNTGELDTEATGNVQNYINSPEARQKVLDDKLTQMASQKASPWQKVWGRDLTADVRTFDPETNAMTMETKSLHQPGYLEKAGQGLKRGLNDLLGGYDENRNQNFSLNNWDKNYLDNGERKGSMYHLGEGLGSFAKLAESPVGRALLVGGIVGAGGGSGLEALAYGSQAGMQNQVNRAKDQLYRNALAERGVDTSNIRGYIGDETFKNFSTNQYKNRRLNQETYNKLKTSFDKQLQDGSLSPEEYRNNINMLNSKFLDDQIYTIEAGNVGLSNPTRRTNIAEKLAPYQQKYLDARTGYYGTKGQKEEEENADLAEFLAIVQSGDEGAINHARAEFIRRYGIDPSKQIKDNKK